MATTLMLLAAATGFTAPFHGFTLRHSNTVLLSSPTMCLPFSNFFMSKDDTKPPGGFVRASHILLTGPDAPEQAQTVAARIASGDITFADAAAQYSACPSKGKGGDLAVFSSLASLAFLPYESQDVSAFDALVLSPSTPIDSVQTVATDFGTHVVKVTARG